MTLQQWMDMKGLKDRDLAERVGGISRSQVNRIRREGAKSMATAKKLSDFTGLPLESLVPRDGAA